MEVISRKYLKTFSWAKMIQKHSQLNKCFHCQIHFALANIFSLANTHPWYGQKHSQHTVGRSFLRAINFANFANFGAIHKIYDRENRGLVNYGRDSEHVSMWCSALLIVASLRYFKKVSLPNPDGPLSESFLCHANTTHASTSIASSSIKWAWQGSGDRFTKFKSAKIATVKFIAHEKEHPTQGPYFVRLICKAAKLVGILKKGSHNHGLFCLIQNRSEQC